MPSGTSDPTTTRSPAKHRSLALAGVIAAIIGVLAGAFLGPQFQGVGPQTSGDAALAERVRDAVGDQGGFRSLTVAEVTPDSIT